ncbi:MAG TPA: hypothetical protein VLA56_10520, partial [Pseudomonadales bacterium]|nr:hypothetical protein [Pseudomonadales bacterium]
MFPRSAGLDVQQRSPLARLAFLHGGGGIAVAVAPARRRAAAQSAPVGLQEREQQTDQHRDGEGIVEQLLHGPEHLVRRGHGLQLVEGGVDRLQLAAVAGAEVAAAGQLRDLRQRVLVEVGGGVHGLSAES